MAITLKATKREDLSRSAINQIRKEGFIPAVIYGKGAAAQNVTVNNLELLKTVRDEGRNAIISLDIDGGETVEVMVHEYQTNPVKRDITHIDFYLVDMLEEMDVTVAIRIEGEAVGVKDGGILQQPLFELQVRSKPRDIPDDIEVNVAELAIGDSITVADLPVSDKFTILDESDATVAVVLAPQEEEEVDADADASIEPEVIGAKEEEE